MTTITTCRKKSKKYLTRSCKPSETRTVKSSSEFKSLSFFKAFLCHENLSRNRDIAKENNVDNDESDYFVPISGGAEESIPEAINSRINSFNSSDGGSPFILISSDSFTDTDD
ncbi:hypothetical protein DAPPUDRAFT_334190 [Daphnia pulex]|uniref:Uncharacterized protein n=1 Tax=Daphnia pulex TaxID=6669 RepID=E9HUY9_DAPPU|nr:hypothetical protein DAPPUDRAFT_334190 [Daphnia pulex]|eukprot:EFX64433.1 hypothetical protein DAPPUDRAFT_334190 [Daphnia pulex]